VVTSRWRGNHTCETTHCLAGWCQVIRDGERVNEDRAYEAGIRHLPALAHLFFAGDDEALRALRELAGQG